jgi:hypothetical protein
MGDQDIIDTVKKADALLTEYKLLLKPVAYELARRKSLEVYGEEGCYKGLFGCHEEGIQKICLHSVDPTKQDAELDKAIAFEQKWHATLNKEGVKNVYVGGFF